ncbi:MAG: penicillin-binding protein [Rikenellaceae bacterium]|nr:penicillin-binding protein [Rikenellaceae bacterium]
MDIKGFFNDKRKVVKLMWVAVMTPVVILFLMLFLAAAGVFGRMPSFEELENPKSNLATEIYGDNGHVIGTFFVQNRSYVQYEELFPQDSTKHISLDGHVVPPVVAALIATEDERFRSHSGIDIPSLFRVGIKTIALRDHSQGGGSTITQQLAKNLFPRDTVRDRGKIGRTMKLVQSKFKEWITALKLEHNYTKEEIAAMYLNTVAYGSNAYGIKSAASTFFGKSPNELNIQEAAMLVGVVNAPTRYSPVRNPENAMARRNLVINRMRKVGAISRQMCDSLTALPITLNYKPISHNEGEATYFREMLRNVMNAKRPVRRQFLTDWDYEQAVKEYDENPLYGWCLKNQKADGTPYNIYRDGLRIYTTINPTMQRYAEEAVQKQMESVIQPRMDRQVKATGVLFQDTTPEEREAIIKRAMKNSDRYREMKKAGATEKEIFASFNEKCEMRVFTFKGERDTVMSPRDSILHHKRIMRASIVAMDPRSGHVKVYVGGPNFRYFKYDMAKQGKRQIGSTVKPFIYTFAIDQLGLTPCTYAPNLPVSIETPAGIWSPKEAGKVEYDGVQHPLYWGLANSRNNYSAWIMKQAKQPETVADFLHNMGIKSYIYPAYALCLGAFESNVFELVSAYSTFVNEGVHIDPIFVTRIEDRQGNLISSFIPQSQDAVNKHTAYTMLTMLERVITAGTGGRLAWQFGMENMDIGGKTGTSNENRDAWFMCVTPTLVAGSWVGGEDQSVHLSSAGEGSVMALPIVGEFLKRAYADPRLGLSRNAKFSRPEGWESYDCPKELEGTETIQQQAAPDEFFD